MGPTEKQLEIFNSLSHKQRGWGTHNPPLQSWNLGGPTILIEIMALWRLDQGIHSPLVYTIAGCPFAANSGGRRGRLG